MRVNLLPVYDAPLIRNRLGGTLFSAADRLPEPLRQTKTDELRERIRRDKQQEARAAATLVPTRSADVISDAERNVERSSRAFRRQLARGRAADQFRCDRQAFRQALTDAKGKDSPVAARSLTDAKPRPDATQAKPNTELHTATASKTPPQGGTGSTTPPPSTEPTRPPTGQPFGPAAARLPLSASTAATPSAGGTTAPSAVGSWTAALARQNNATLGRAASSAQVQAAKPSGTSGVKAGSAASAARGTAKLEARAAAKTGGQRPAESAKWDANIERIVRVIRNRIGRQRSQTVVRLDPPELGRLRLQMDLRGEALTLRIDTSTDVAHRLLSEELHKLRHGLEASGIQLERVEVRPPTQTAETNRDDLPQHDGTQDEARGGSAETGAEHPEERGTDSYPAELMDGTARQAKPEPAAESLVNIVA